MKIDGTPIDAQGNPMIRVGCPNCGKGAGWSDVISYAAALNSGREPAGPCSRRCRLQIEHAAGLAARDVIEVAEGITAGESSGRRSS